jgi:hypothetical protein
MPAEIVELHPARQARHELLLLRDEHDTLLHIDSASENVVLSMDPAERSIIMSMLARALLLLASDPVANQRRPE